MKAVLTGVNIYQHYPDDGLRGCCNDAKSILLWAHNELGFVQSAIKVLLDSKATAAREKSAVLEMITQAGPGDHVLWFHSSHGSNNPDPTQKDGLQELLLNYDLQEERPDFWDEDTCISAWWIGETIRNLHPEATLDMIFDCCNAPEGSQLKAIGRRYYASKFLPRPERGIPVAPKLIQQVQATIPKNVALWASCEPSQTSADAQIAGEWQGAFTAAFLEAFKPGRTRADIIALARQWLKDNGYRQTPHLYTRQTMALGKMV